MHAQGATIRSGSIIYVHTGRRAWADCRVADNRVVDIDPVHFKQLAKERPPLVARHIDQPPRARRRTFGRRIANPRRLVNATANRRRAQRAILRITQESLPTRFSCIRLWPVRTAHAQRVTHVFGWWPKRQLPGHPATSRARNVANASLGATLLKVSGLRCAVCDVQ